MAHTKGNWFTDSRRRSPLSDERVTRVWSNCDGEELLIAELGEQGGEERANAELIAAAPEMLSALRDAHMAISLGLAYMVENGADAEQLRQARIKVYTAIAMTEGEGY